MLAVRDMLLYNAGFDWPYLFVTCLPFNNDVETTTQILTSHQPGMIALERYDINDQVISMVERA
jgi:hypothetical protein